MDKNKQPIEELLTIGIIFLTIFIPGLPIYLISTEPNSNLLSFWGSYAGGIISGLVVIVTTYWILRRQNKTLQDQILAEDKRERKRFKQEFLFKSNEKILTNLTEAAHYLRLYEIATTRVKEYNEKRSSFAKQYQLNTELDQNYNTDYLRAQRDEYEKLYFRYLDEKSDAQLKIDLAIDHVFLYNNSMDNNEGFYKMFSDLNRKVQRIFTKYHDLIENKKFNAISISLLKDEINDILHDLNEIRIFTTDRYQLLNYL